MSLFSTLGRMALSTAFVNLGLNGLQNPGFAAQVAEQAGLPEPELLEQVHNGINLAAGAAMGLGIFPRLSALLLAGNLVPTTVLAHNPNDADDEQGRQAQLIHVVKNISLFGALLMVAGSGGSDDDQDLVAELEATIRELAADD